MPTPIGRGARFASAVAAVLLGAVAPLAGCGGGSSDAAVISATPASLHFSGVAPAPQTITIAFKVPPTQVVLAGHPEGVNPTCVGIDPTCRLDFTLVSGPDANPLVYAVTIMDTTASHTSTLRFVSTDLAYQTAFGMVDVPVSYVP